jgi:hypothetical protein
MDDPSDIDAKFNAQVARSLHREALRRAAHDVNKTFGPGLENVLEQISADSTAEAAERVTGHENVVPEALTPTSRPRLVDSSPHTREDRVKIVE